MMTVENTQALEQERKYRFHLDPRHPITIFKRKGEPVDHVILKALAYAIYWPTHEVSLDVRFSGKYQPDLAALDLSGDPILWIECGQADADKLEYALKHTHAPEVVLVTRGPIGPVVEDLRKKIHYRYTRGRLKVIAFLMPLEEFCLDPVEVPLGSYETYSF